MLNMLAAVAEHSVQRALRLAPLIRKPFYRINQADFVDILFIYAVMATADASICK